MRRPIHLTSVALLLMMLALAAGAQATTQTATQQETFSLVAGGTFVLSNVNGSVTIEGWEGSEISLEAVKKAKSGSRESAQEALENIRLEIDRSADRIEIKTRLPKSSTGFNFGRGTSASVSYSLKIPDGLNLRISTVNGGLEARNLDGRMKFSSTNGSIQVESATGSVRASTTNGRIEVQLDEVTADEDLAFSTTNGSIRLQLPADIQADIEARTVNGNIDSDLPVEVTGHINRRRLEGTINGGGAKLHLSTTNGSIRLEKN